MTQVETGARFYYLKFNKYVVLSSMRKKREKTEKLTQSEWQDSGVAKNVNSGARIPV